MRIIFMGSPDFRRADARRAGRARAMKSSPLYPAAAPAGRGKAETADAVEERARRAGHRSAKPEIARGEAEQQEFAALEADVAVVAAYGLILPQPILDAPMLGCLNVHASLLPRWRGAAPVQRAIMAGDEATGSPSCRWRPASIPADALKRAR
jgi:methionyl-tRNA formyltransferase